MQLDDSVTSCLKEAVEASCVVYEERFLVVACVNGWILTISSKLRRSMEPAPKDVIIVVVVIIINISIVVSLILIPTACGLIWGCRFDVEE